MSSAINTSRAYGIDGDWGSAGVAGVVAGIVFGLLIQFVVGSMAAVGALFGQPGILTGWVVHLTFSIAFGLLFAAVAEWQPIAGYATSATTGVGIGLAYGAVLWAINLAFIWPLWLNAVGFPPGTDLAVPFLAMKPLVGHLVYGAILGAAYPLIR